MNKFKITAIFLIFLSTTVLSQTNETTVYNIHNYRHDLAVSIDANKHSSIKLDEYGKILKLVGTAKHRYLFQGQEYDREIGIYYFPARIYSSGSKRFFSTDPKSQYHSPYLFVGADPINIIDIDGMAGKPLILFGEDHRLPGSKDLPTMDLMEDFPNAHYVPISDFVNGKVGDLSEWNGNVFIKSHMGQQVANEMGIERAPSSDMLKTNSLAATEEAIGENDYMITLDAEELGGMLREFSEARNVPIKNIVAGGCEGESAAKGIYEGFMAKGTARAEASAGTKLTVSGVKANNRMMYTGRKSIMGLKGEKFSGPFFKTRAHIKPVQAQKLYITGRNSRGERYLRKWAQDVDGVKSPMKYVEGVQLEDLLNGRVPENFAGEFTVYHGIY